MMSPAPPRRLTADQIAALRFAARRQLARWSNKTGLSAHQQAQHTELRRTVDMLSDDALVRGCELAVPTDEGTSMADGWRKIDRGLLSPPTAWNELQW